MSNGDDNYYPLSLVRFSNILGRFAGQDEVQVMLEEQLVQLGINAKLSMIQGKIYFMIIFESEEDRTLFKVVNNLQLMYDSNNPGDENGPVYVYGK